MNKIAIIIIVLLFDIFNIQAGEKNKLFFSFEGGLDSYNTWNLMPGLTYKPIHYIGLSGGLKFTGFWNNDRNGFSMPSTTGLCDIHDQNDLAYHIAFQPAIRAFSPKIKIDNQDDFLYFSLGYGAIIPFSRQGKSEVNFFRIEGNTNILDYSETIKDRKDKNNVYQFADLTCYVECDRWNLGLGYRISNYDIYGCSRNFYVENRKVDFPKYKVNSEFYIIISYSLIKN